MSHGIRLKLRHKPRWWHPCGLLVLPVSGWLVVGKQTVLSAWIVWMSVLSTSRVRFRGSCFRGSTLLTGFWILRKEKWRSIQVMFFQMGINGNRTRPSCLLPKAHQPSDLKQSAVPRYLYQSGWAFLGLKNSRIKIYFWSSKPMEQAHLDSSLH